MKKTLSITILLAMLCALLSGCGAQSEPEGEGTPAALWIVLGAAVFLAAAVIVFAVIVSKKDRNGKDGGGFKE